MQWPTVDALDRSWGAWCLVVFTPSIFLLGPLMFVVAPGLMSGFPSLAALEAGSGNTGLQTLRGLAFWLIGPLLGLVLWRAGRSQARWARWIDVALLSCLAPAGVVALGASAAAWTSAPWRRHLAWATIWIPFGCALLLAGVATPGKANVLGHPTGIAVLCGATLLFVPFWAWLILRFNSASVHPAAEAPA